MVRALRTWTRGERMNFLLTNRIPRRAATRFMGWFSTIESPALTRAAIAAWRIFDEELDLSESREHEFRSLRDCFIRELREGARPVDDRTDVVTSPCDAIVGACGRVEGDRVYQAKGFPYELGDLLPDVELRERLQNGVYVTLRLTPGMYHRFHAPMDCRVEGITYVSGDTWNVNPVALRRIEKLYCRNERAVVPLLPFDAGDSGPSVVLVPVAAILVASMKFHCLPGPLDLRYRGPARLDCRASYRKGDELGWFQHGSTILVFATAGHGLATGVVSGARIRMGEALLTRAQANGRVPHGAPFHGGEAT